MVQIHWMAICGLIVLALAAGNLWFYLRVLRPIRHLARQASQLTGGDLDSLERACGGIREIRHLRRAMAGMVKHVRRAQEQSRAYTDRLADVLEIERKRIARELHDDTVQSAIVVSHRIDLARGWIDSDPSRAADMLASAREQTVAIVTALRQLIAGLRPPALEELGLITALKTHIASLQQVEVDLKVDGNPRRLDEAHELALFRAAQESLSNVIRHSEVQQAVVWVSYSSDHADITITDDGRGFEPPVQPGDLAFDGHYGLLGIHERVASLGGQLTIDSAVGRGTTIAVTLPVMPGPQPAHWVRDPVCSAWIEPRQAYGSTMIDGSTYYFCCPVCQGAFQHDPAAYIPAATVVEPA
jgi:two-component system sensor histidine kinase UhpB